MPEEARDVRARLEQARLEIIGLEREIRLCKEGLAEPGDDHRHLRARLRYAETKLADLRALRAALLAHKPQPPR